MSATDWVGKKNANGSTTWHWEDNITSAEQAKAAGYDDYKAPGSTLENTKIEDGPVATVHFGTKEEGIGYDESNFTNWNAVHGSSYDTRVEAYRTWQSESGYHRNESWFDRTMRVMAWGSMEARRDYAAGGMNMYGGYGRLAKATEEGMTTVGRWMSQAEYDAMKAGGRVLEGAGGKTSVAIGGPDSFTAAAKGSVYAEFEVPTNSLVQGGQSNWFSILSPNASKSQLFMLQKQGGQVLPKIQNLTSVLKVK